MEGCKAVRTHTNVLEVMDNDVSKAAGIGIIQKIHNFSNDDIVACGDGENDIEMLTKAKYSFAMTNHQPKVCTYADHTIDQVHQIETILKKYY
ncbi:HAD family hydrolase [Spiroplasma clarkii]|uniref:HAD family hydrolase n=1 Tax=Spiroplasma clarkii TaxID=2139 RepID=UPI00214F9280|nr:HAD hydrolase family protein [Spiroplasma clarkii]